MPQKSPPDSVKPKKNKKSVAKKVEKPKKKKSTTPRKKPGPKPKPREGLDRLTLNQYRMFIARVHDGEKYVDAYHKGWPKSTMSRLNQAKRAYIEWQKIVEILGGHTAVLEIAGLGPERLYKAIDDALEAERVIIKGDKMLQTPDHRVRLRAAKEIRGIYGLEKSTVKLEGEVKHDFNMEDVLALVRKDK